MTTTIIWLGLIGMVVTMVALRKAGFIAMDQTAGLPAGFASGSPPDPYSPAPPYNVLTTPINGLQAWQSGCWFKYINNYGAYLCPVDIATSADYLPPSGAGGRQNKLSTYVQDGAVVGFRNYNGNPAGTPCKSTAVWSPMCYLLWEPNENDNGFGNPWSL